MPYRAYTYVGMQIADVEDSEIVKCREDWRKPRMLFDYDVVSVSTRTAIKSSHRQRSSDNSRCCVPVFEIEEDQSLAEQLGLMLSFDFQSPINMS
jgi:hypothetical protein